MGGWAGEWSLFVSDYNYAHYLGGDKICPYSCRLRRIILSIMGWQKFVHICLDLGTLHLSTGDKISTVGGHPDLRRLDWCTMMEPRSLEPPPPPPPHKFFKQNLNFFGGHKRLKTEAKQHHPWAIQEGLFVRLLWMISSIVDWWDLSL